MDELSPEESERFFERLERELSLGRCDRAVRRHVHRAGDSLQHALALTRGAAAAGVTTAGYADLSQFQVTRRDDGRRCGRRSSRRRQVGRGAMMLSRGTRPHRKTSREEKNRRG
jgi:hypothetical protein